MKKIIFLLIALILVMGLTAGLTACGNTAAQKPDTAVQPSSTTAPQPQLFDNLGRPTTVDGYGQPITAVKFGPEKKDNEISIANPSLGISLSIEYRWQGEYLIVLITNNGTEPLNAGSTLRVAYFNEKGEPSFVDGVNLSQLKPGESRQVKWTTTKDNPNPQYQPNKDWYVGWSIIITK